MKEPHSVFLYLKVYGFETYLDGKWGHETFRRISAMEAKLNPLDSLK